MSGWLIAPYAAWMALMLLLPSAPWAYAARTAVTLALLLAAAGVVRQARPADFRALRPSWGAALAGVAAGLFVGLVWIAPDRLGWYREYCVIGDPYGAAAAVPLDSVLTWVRLGGSAFVIATAEELFFRRWLIRFAGFGWMVALFAIEHDRYLVGAVAGVVYGLVFLRRGLAAAVIAHVVTNLALGVFVLATGRWEFWG